MLPTRLAKPRLSWHCSLLKPPATPFERVERVGSTRESPLRHRSLKSRAADPFACSVRQFVALGSDAEFEFCGLDPALNSSRLPLP